MNLILEKASSVCWRIKFTPFLKTYFCLFIFLVSWGYTSAQVVSYQASSKSLTDVLEDLKINYDLHFAYDAEEVNRHLVDVNAREQKLDAFMYNLLRGTGLSYKFIDKGFAVIKPIAEIGLDLKSKISNLEGDSPLPFATIRVKGTYKGTYSDQNGDFSLHLDNPDSTDLEISFVGYEPIVINARQFYEEGLESVRLKPLEFVLDEIAIVEYLNNAITLDPAQAFKIRLKPKEMTVLPGLAESDLLYSIQMLPGVVSSDETASGINVRGSGEDQALIYWDRIPVYHTAHYFGLVSSITPFTVEKLEVFRSGIPIDFNGASAGLIDMQSQDEVQEKPSYLLGLNFTHGSFYTKAPLVKEKLQFEIAARRSYNDWVATPTYNSYEERLFAGSRLEDIVNDFRNVFGDEINENNDIRFWDYQSKLLYQINKKNLLSFSLLQSENEFEFSTENLDPDRQFRVTEDMKNQHLGVNLFWRANWSEKDETQVSISYSNYDFKQEFSFLRPVDGISELDFSQLLNEVDNIEAKLMYRHQVNEYQRLELGYQFNYIKSNFDYREENRLESNFRDVFQPSSDMHSLYFNHHLKIKEKLFLNTGIKYRYFRENEQHFYEPVISLNYLPHPSWQLKFTYGLYRQFLRTIRDVDLNPSNAQGKIWILSSSQEIPEVSNRQLGLGLVYNEKGWLLDLEVYHKQIDGLISSNYSRGGDNQRLDFTPGSGTIWGIDLMLKKRWKWYRNWLSYSYAQGDNTFPDLQIELGLANPTFPSFLDIRHQFQWIHTIEWGAFEFSLAWSFRSSLPITEPVGVNEIIRLGEDEEGNLTNEIIDRYFDLDWGEINSRRLPNYHRLDVSIWYRFPKNPDAAWQGKLGLAWLNLYNQKNIQNRSFYLDDPEGAVIIRSEEQLFIRSTPNISLEFQF